MEARLLFLGTAGDIFAVGKQLRASAGIMLQVGNSQLHIDPGPGALVMAKMMGVNLRENTALLVTANDLLRANDANAVISTMTHDGMDKRGVLVCPAAVVSDSEKEIGPFVNKHYKNCLEKTITLENTRKIGINDVDIEIIELKVPINEACGLKFITQRFSLGYLPDTPYFPELGERFKNTDVLIINVLDSRNSKRKDHLNSEDAQKIIEEVKPQLAILTGFGIKMIQSNPLYEAREIQKATGIQVISAKDGMTINPISFTTAVRQKNLNSF